MSFARAKLPEDYDSLRAFALSMQAELFNKTLLIEKYKAQLAALRRARFGRSSEKLDQEIMQMELLLADLEEGQAQVNAAGSAATSADASPAPRQERTQPRRSLPEHLAREVIEHKPDCICPDCGGTRLRQIGTDDREVLEYVPSHFKVIVHSRPKLACRDCEAITQMPMPSIPIERGMPGPGLLAHVLTAKYCDHLPLYRQSEIYARENVELDRSTLASWVGHMAYLLTPLADAIDTHVRLGTTLHADDTPVPVLDPGRGKTKTGRLWALLRDERPFSSNAPPAVIYQYSSNRKSEWAQNLLNGCQGYLHADAYAGFNGLYTSDSNGNPPRFQEVACWAHARRKIYEVHVATQSPAALDLLERISKLFAIEAECKGQSSEERLRVREKRCVPLLEELKNALESALSKVSSKSTLAQAIRYTLVRWPSFTRYSTDGRLEISNNAVERAIRPLALGRKNWLFAGSDTGGQRTAVMYTIIQTAKLNGINPEAYLRDVINRIADHPMKKIDELLPWAWSKIEIAAAA